MTLPFLEAATPLALQAAERIMQLRLEPLVHQRKPDHSLVTNADHAADAIIRTGLRKAFPNHALLTEESGLDGDPRSDYCWVVDPLDGTKAYAGGLSGFSVMIGLLKMGKPFAGVVVDPVEGHLYEAVRGEGSFHTLNGQRERVHVSKRDHWEDMPLIVSTGFPDPWAEKLQKALPSPAAPSVNSVGVKIGLMVRQKADLYVNHHSIHYWDACAPQVILEEAGGRFTFFDGSDLIYQIPGTYALGAATFATNTVRHDEFGEVLRTLFPKAVLK